MPPARATVVPTPGPCKASAAARRPRQSACPGVPSCSQQPQNTARATGFSHTRPKPKAKSQKPRASCLAPCCQLSLPRTPLPGWRRSSAKGRPAALAGNRTRVNCLEGSYAHHYTTNAAQPGPPPDAGRGLAPAHSRRRRRRIPAPTPRQREALRRRRRHPQPPSKPIRASSTQRPGSTGPAAPGRRSCGLAVPRTFAPRRGPPTPPPSPPGGATRGTQLPAASWPKPFSTGRWARPLPTTTGGHGGRPPAGVPGLREEPTEAAPEGGRAARSGCGRARPWGGQGGRRSALATERPATTKGSGWRAARVEGVGRGQAGPQGGGRTRRALGGQAAGQRATAATKKAVLPPRRGIEPRSPA